ncbi:Putative periplasmic protein kinase [Croceitalea dokdonensis DOKDO 023]|uniref:Putative periplasmic protein kinase n=1 Tax=Croceitalea dokdonensis DOKDO 023 TaxID=1300341 RepID=A0A0P7AIX4_9FLAO|nr:methylmalonyl Co-A mutase-associated GTPase MeaB [Croceitalea dokdonensis]KPM31741.1 Putative periplasmic protein kinase [Croceitalea dokdonensis DOKDO 023]
MPSKYTAPHIANKVRKLRKASIDVTLVFNKLIAGDKTALAQAITLIESTRESDFQLAENLVNQCLTIPSKGIRIGITGVPGVGKSTFIEALGGFLTAMGKKVAVLAVDPSSSFTKGSILGDKTRMETLAKDPNAFIRPSPASDALGGVTRKTRETLILCEAAAFDVVLVETVGVGQSETAVHSMVDFFLLLKLAGAGDELQGIKRGIMEMADAIVINKADGSNLNQVKIARGEFKRALHLYPPKENQWTPTVLSCSALHNLGIEAVWETISHFMTMTKANGHFAKNRTNQNKNWFLQSVDALLKHQFYANSQTKDRLKQLLNQVETNQISPYAAAKALVQK